MGAKSTNVTSKQMLPLFQVISDLERPGGSNTSNRTNNSNYYFDNTSILGSEDIIVHHYSRSDNLIPVEFLGVEGSASDFGNVPIAHRIPFDGSSSKKKLSKKRSKKRRRLKMDQGRDDIDYQFKGKKVVDKQRSHHKHKESDNHHKPHKHTSKKHKDEQLTDASAHSSSLKINRKRTGLFTEMGLDAYKDDDIDISRHFKNITKDDFNSETDNITIFDNSDGPSYEVPKDIIARNVHRSRRNISRSGNSVHHDVIVENYEDSSGRIARVTRSKNKMSSKHVVKKYEEMLATLLAKCEQKDVQIQEKDSQILKMKNKIKDLFVCNNQFADENEFLKRQHDDMKICIEQYKSCVSSMEEQLRRREEECGTTSRGICANCSTNEVSAIKAGRLNSQLTEDLLMLKNVVYRLNVQLLRYQEKLRSAQPSGVHESNVPPSSAAEQKGVGAVEQPNEGATDGTKVDVEGLSIPSLPTFGDDAAKLQDAKSHADLDQKFLAEKRLNFAEEQQKTYSIECEEQSAWGDVNTHTLAPLLNSYQESIVEKDQLIRDYESEFNRFTAKLKQVVEENNAIHLSSSKMAAELAVHKGKSGMATAERDSLRRENQELRDKAVQLAEKLKEVHELYEQKLEAVSRDYNLIHEEYFKCKTNLAATQSRCQTLEDQRKGVQNTVPTNVYNNTVQECKRLFEELKNRYEADKGRLAARLAVLQESNSHLESRILDLSCEKQKVETKAKSGDKLIRKCRKEVAMLRGELAATKAARDSAKRRSGHATNLCRQMAVELHKGVAGEQAQQVRAEKILVQKEALKELDAVEHRMLEQNRDLEMIKRKSATEISRLEDMLRESNATTEAMRQHINKERLNKYGTTSSGIQHVPEELAKMRLRSRNEEGARSNIPFSSSAPAKGDIFIQRVRTKDETHK